MAIRTKAEMLAGITSMFADNDEGDITAAIARSEFNDWIESLLVPGGIVGGAGISVSDNGDGSTTISAAGAAAAVGIPSYVAAAAAQPSDAVVTANIAGVTDSPPFPSLVYLLDAVRASTGRPTTSSFGSTATRRGCGRWLTFGAIRSQCT